MGLSPHGAWCAMLASSASKVAGQGWPLNVPVYKLLPERHQQQQQQQQPSRACSDCFCHAFEHLHASHSTIGDDRHTAVRAAALDQRPWPRLLKPRRTELAAWQLRRLSRFYSWMSPVTIQEVRDRSRLATIHWVLRALPGDNGVGNGSTIRNRIQGSVMVELTPVRLAQVTLAEAVSRCGSRCGRR
jgi:hypothetical protein